MLHVAHFSPAVFSQWHAQADAWLLPLVHQAAADYQSLGIHAVSNQWLMQQEWKRAIAYRMFHDLLADDRPRLRILEIGGGLSALSEQLARRHDYTLIELATHETTENYQRLEAHVGRSFVTLADWNEVHLDGVYDVVVANDLFPNVDQRLEGFMDWALPHARQLRMTLTYYEKTSWQVRRTTSGETLTVCPWNLRMVGSFLEGLVIQYPEACPDYDWGQLVYQDYENVLFSNRRNILYCELTSRAGFSAGPVEDINNHSRPRRRHASPVPAR